ncbi:MAG TPA: LON peptidase substrate-binding domain-containing protein [Patescibacteria group bacterium]|nr:LON peptidase substrate-binding domain-containing protein [Patescibacteria group bacterium]
MELPLFPLNSVLCPGIALPLHIFEDRYRAMVRHCLETTSPFGVVLIRDGREVGAGSISFTGVGTIAEIRDAGTYDDGRYDLLVVGTRRFEIRRVLTGRRPYLVAEVDILDEAVGDDDTAHRLAMRATRRFVSYLELLRPRVGETADEIDVRVEVEAADDGKEPADRGSDDPPADEIGGAEPPDDPAGTPRRRRVTIPDDPTVLSFLLAGILQVESPRRQALLEAATTEDRLRDLLGLIDREVFLLDQRLRIYRPEPRMVGAHRS